MIKFQPMKRVDMQTQQEQWCILQYGQKDDRIVGDGLMLRNQGRALEFGSRSEAQAWIAKHAQFVTAW